MTRIEIAHQADEQIERADEWWTQNRRAARGLFRDELSDALDKLRDAPELGMSYEPMAERGYRRLLMPRTRYYVYYSFDRDEDLVQIKAVWHAARGRGPSL